MQSRSSECPLTVIDLPPHLLVHEPTQRDQPHLDERYHPQHRPRQRIHGDIVDRFGDAGIAIGVDLSGVLEDRPEFRDLSRRENTARRLLDTVRHR
jgi:hypothetical protein